MSLDATIAALAHPDARHRLAALEELATAPLLDDDALLAVVACLATPKKAVQRQAAELLCRGGASSRAVVMARLRAGAVDPDPRLRWGATYTLARLGIRDPELLSPLLEALGRPDGDERWAAAELVTAWSRSHADIVLPALLAAARDPNAERRKMALYVLRDVAAAEPATRVVTYEALVDRRVSVRFAALAALVRLEPLPADACEVVLGLCRDDPDPGLRRAALGALGFVGRGVAAARAAITAAARSDDAALRRAARLAERRLGS